MPLLGALWRYSSGVRGKGEGSIPSTWDWRSRREALLKRWGRVAWDRGEAFRIQEPRSWEEGEHSKARPARAGAHSVNGSDETG